MINQIKKNKLKITPILRREQTKQKINKLQIQINHVMRSVGHRTTYQKGGRKLYIYILNQLQKRRQRVLNFESDVTHSFNHSFR